MIERRSGFPHAVDSNRSSGPYLPRSTGMDGASAPAVALHKTTLRAPGAGRAGRRRRLSRPCGRGGPQRDLPLLTSSGPGYHCAGVTCPNMVSR